MGAAKRTAREWCQAEPVTEIVPMADEHPVMLPNRASRRGEHAF